MRRFKLRREKGSELRRIVSYMREEGGVGSMTLDVPDQDYAGIASTKAIPVLPPKEYCQERGCDRFAFKLDEGSHKIKIICQHRSVYFVSFKNDVGGEFRVNDANLAYLAPTAKKLKHDGKYKDDSFAGKIYNQERLLQAVEALSQAKEVDDVKDEDLYSILMLCESARSGAIYNFFLTHWESSESCPDWLTLVVHNWSRMCKFIHFLFMNPDWAGFKIKPEVKTALFKAYAKAVDMAKYPSLLIKNMELMLNLQHKLQADLGKRNKKALKFQTIHPLWPDFARNPHLQRNPPRGQSSPGPRGRKRPFHQTQQERAEAQSLSASKEAEEEVKKESAKTFPPGEVPNTAEAAQEQQAPKVVAPTPEQIIAIKAAVVNSQTLEEVARLEKALNSGQIPAELKFFDIDTGSNSVKDKDDKMDTDGDNEVDAVPIMRKRRMMNPHLWNRNRRGLYVSC